MRLSICILAILCVILMANGSCADNPLRMEMDYVACVPERNKDTGRELSVKIKSSDFLQQPVTQTGLGLCPTLQNEETCCDDKSYTALGNALMDMKAYMDEVRKDMTLVSQRGVFSIDFFFWLIEKVVTIIVNLISSIIESPSTVQSVQSAFETVLKWFSHVVEIIKIVLDMTPQLVDADQCGTLEADCTQIEKECETALAACAKDKTKPCDPLENECTKRIAICQNGQSISEAKDCGSIVNCWDAVVNVAAGHMCLACTPSWNDYISCSDGHCIIKLDDTTASKMVGYCSEFAIMFIPNMIGRVFAYIMNEMMDCPTTSPDSVTGADVDKCLTTNDTGVTALFLQAISWMMKGFDSYKQLAEKVPDSIMDLALANVLFSKAAGFDISIAFADHWNGLDDFGMFYFAGLILDFNEWVWDTFWSWLPRDGTMGMIVDAVIGALVYEYAKEKPEVTVPPGVPGYTKVMGLADENTSVYTASVMNPTDHRMNTRIWAASRGGVAPYLSTPGLYRSLEARGIITKADYRRPGGVSLDRLRQLGYTEEVEAAIKENEIDVVDDFDNMSVQERRDAGLVKVQGTRASTTYTADYTFSTNFAYDGFNAWDRGCETGVVERFKKGSTDDGKIDNVSGISGPVGEVADKAIAVAKDVQDEIMVKLNVNNQVAMIIMIGVISVLVIMVLWLCCRKPKYPQLQTNYSGYNYY